MILQECKNFERKKILNDRTSSRVVDLKHSYLVIKAHDDKLSTLTPLNCVSSVTKNDG